MKIEINELEDSIYGYADKIKDVLSAEIWQSLLLDCTKNELLILWFLYRRNEATMTQAAEYIKAPLNTVTGIVSRMEKRKFIIRERSIEDKRVVTIMLDSLGKLQIEQIMSKVLSYGKKLMEELSSEEVAVILKVFDRLPAILKEDRDANTVSSKVRKITIE